MKQEIRIRLADALESGEYVQTQRYMKRGPCMCVLGVLCDLYAKENGITDPWKLFPAGPLNNDPKYGFLGTDYLRGPPDEVASWAGIMTKGGILNDFAGNLVRMNDKGFTFGSIAQEIRKGT